MRSKLGNTPHFMHSLLLVPLVSALFFSESADAGGGLKNGTTADNYTAAAAVLSVMRNSSAGHNDTHMLQSTNSSWVQGAHALNRTEVPKRQRSLRNQTESGAFNRSAAHNRTGGNSRGEGDRQRNKRHGKESRNGRTPRSETVYDTFSLSGSGRADGESRESGSGRAHGRQATPSFSHQRHGRQAAEEGVIFAVKIPEFRTQVTALHRTRNYRANLKLRLVAVPAPSNRIRPACSTSVTHSS